MHFARIEADDEKTHQRDDERQPVFGIAIPQKPGSEGEPTQPLEDRVGCQRSGQICDQIKHGSGGRFSSCRLNDCHQLLRQRAAHLSTGARSPLCRAGNIGRVTPMTLGCVEFIDPVDDKGPGVRLRGAKGKR